MNVSNVVYSLANQTKAIVEAARDLGIKNPVVYKAISGLSGLAFTQCNKGFILDSKGTSDALCAIRNSLSRAYDESDCNVAFIEALFDSILDLIELSRDIETNGDEFAGKVGAVLGGLAKKANEGEYNELAQAA